MLSKKKPQDKVDPEYLVGLDTASAQPAPAGVKPFIKKHWKPIIAVVCAAAVAAAVLVPKNSAKPAAASAQYVETRPEKRNMLHWWNVCMGRSSISALPAPSISTPWTSTQTIPRKIIRWL